jgi:hypothetical protein
LHRYDLVFAKARCAMEAMAVGCAVIVLSEGMGMAGMVTSANIADWRQWNFGRRLLVRHAIDEAQVRAAIRSYSATDAAAVSAYIRTHTSLEFVVDALDDLAVRILRASVEPIPPHSETQEFARYVHDFVLSPGATRIAHQVALLQNNATERAHGEADRARRQEERVKCEAERADRASERAKYEGMRATREAERARRALAKLAVARDKLVRKRKKLDAIRSSYAWRATAPLRWVWRQVAALCECAREGRQ